MWIAVTREVSASLGACGSSSAKSAHTTATKAADTTTTTGEPTTTTTVAPTTTTLSLAARKAALCVDVERTYQDEVLSQAAGLVADANSLIDRLADLAGPGQESKMQTLHDNANKGTLFAGIVVTQMRTSLCGQ